MPTLEIDGIGDVEVDAKFLSLSPAEQAATVDEIIASVKDTPKPKPERGTFLDAFVGQGLLMGAGDEIKSAVRAGVQAPFKDETFGELYDKELSNRRADLAGYRERHPVLAGAGEIGGAVAGAVAMPGAAVARIPAAATRLGKLGQAGLAGAGLGGVYGFNSGEGGLENRIESGVSGGLIGGLTGGAGQAAIMGGGAALRGGRRLKDALGRVGEAPQTRAVRMINERLASDDMTAQQAAARMRRAQADPNSPNLTLMDVAQDNTVGLAQTASINPGPGRRIINQAVERRAKGQPQRTMGAAAKALGDPNAFKQTGEALAAQRAAHGDQLYGAAWQTARPVDVEPIIQRIDGMLPKTKGGIETTLKKVRTLLLRKGTMGDLAERDLEALHYSKMELDNILSSRGDDSMGRVSRAEVARTRAELLKAMDRASPAYAAARSVYADESALMNALETGRRFLREDVDDLADTMKSMGSAEKKMFMQGAVREVRNIIETAPDGADVVKRVFGSEAKRKALKSVFPNEKEFRKFTATMLREAKARQTRDIVGVRRGSRTAVVEAEQQSSGAVNEFAGGLAMDMALTGGGVTAANVANSTTRNLSKLLQSQNKMTPEVAEEVARIMVAENPDEVVRILSMGPAARRALPPPLPGISRGAMPIAVGATAGMLPR